MTHGEKMFVAKAVTNKIGATRAHNLLSSMKGGYEYVHGTTDDFKNHQRDVNVFIGESDAQIFINKMENRKMYVPNFTFQYKVENSELVAMFWADEVAKCNYKEFADIVSFDATFNNNKYNMKFVPFIGIDNHRKCVTLGLGMLLHEDTKSYTWLLNAFMTAFLKEPTMIVIDQNGAMKRAIEVVFKKAKHRLCMWHIMQKIPSKFEEKCAQLIEDFGLQSHKWMTKMYNIREIWIPAYFIDSPLYGLMRTTSRVNANGGNGWKDGWKWLEQHGDSLQRDIMAVHHPKEYDGKISCGTLTKGNEKRKGMEETSKSRGSWKENKKAKVGTGFMVTAPPRNEFVGSYPKQVAPVNAVRMGNLLALEGNCNTRNNGNQTRGRAFNVNVNTMEALQDPNIEMGTFSLIDHFATVLFYSGADFSFIYTEFAPLLNVKPSIVNPGYVIEVADGNKVKVDRIICDCKLELGNSLFSINLKPLGHGSFDVIVEMDWLSQSAHNKKVHSSMNDRV
ncbi:regulation of nuclear pre-mRNA domain-containing protein 1B [Tanacetum coccineum]